MYLYIEVLTLVMISRICLATGLRPKRQAGRNPLNEAMMEPEGRMLDPAFLSMMFSNAGILPSSGSSTMNNAFSALCTYPYIYYYYPMCMGSSGAGMYPSYAGSSPNFDSPSQNYPMFSPASNGVETGARNGFDMSGFGSNQSPGHFMNPYAWPTNPNEAGTVPGGSTGGPDAGSNGNVGPNGPGSMPPPVPNPSNPGSGSPSGSAGLQPLIPSALPRNKPFNPRGSPLLSGIPLTNPVFEPLQYNQVGIANPANARDNTPLQMLGPLFDERALDQSVNRSSSKFSDSLNDVKKTLKVFSKLVTGGRPVSNITKPFEDMLRIGFNLIERPHEATFMRIWVNATEDKWSVMLPGWLPMVQSRVKAFNLVMDAFKNSTSTHSITCVSSFFCEAARLLNITGALDELKLLEIIGAFAGELLESVHANAKAAISTGVSAGKESAVSCMKSLCT